MTDSQSSLSEVPALLEERHRYESWLAALEARRESTPQHVFDRVQSDYRARLQRVAEQIALHRHAIEHERGQLESRLSLLEAEEGMRRDERAELELRAHVGELAGVEAESAFGTVDQSIALLTGERQTLSNRIAELGALLGPGAQPAAPVDAPAPAPVAAPAAATVVAEASAPAAPAAPVAEVNELVPAVAHAASVPADVPVAVEQSIEPAPAPVAAPVVPPAAAAAPAKPEVRPAGAPAIPPAKPAEVPRQRPARGSFDEMAFLSSVVGKEEGGAPVKAEGAVAAPPANSPLVERRSSEPLLKAPAGIVQEENAGESLLAGVEHVHLATGEHPLAANVPGNTPIVLRTSATLEQAKTLKCNECGGLNYPTEWYCERCGAELAAL
jgi:hypothetical protein